MVKEVLSPNFEGESISQPTFSHWYKQLGETVEEGEVLGEIETEKTSFEVISPVKGFLLYVGVDSGALLKDKELLALVGDKDGDCQKILKAYNKSIDQLKSYKIVYRPKIGKDVFIAHNATVVGKVSLGDQSSVWYTAVIRGDEEEIIVGEQTNIQDGCVLHADKNEPTVLGKGCIVGHGAIVHGANIGDHTLIGIRATILNRAKIGNYCLIGAHALVTQDMEIPDYSVVMGCPGKIVKKLSAEHIEMFKQGALTYVELAKEYAKGTYAEAERTFISGD
ncbi:MAG: biotin/lipoyl-containing protein [Bacteroidota bacterium]